MFRQILNVIVGRMYFAYKCNPFVVLTDLSASTMKYFVIMDFAAEAPNSVFSCMISDP